MGRVLFVTEDSLNSFSIRKIFELYQEMFSVVGISVEFVSLKYLKGNMINISGCAKNYGLVAVVYESVLGHPSKQITHFLKSEYSSKDISTNLILHPLLQAEANDLLGINISWNPYLIRKKVQLIVPEPLLHIRPIENFELSSTDLLFRDINKLVLSLLKRA